MEEKDRKALKDNLDTLSKNCTFCNIFLFLKDRNVFTARQIQHYESDNFRTKGEDIKCQQLFTDIQTRGPKAFDILLECLQKTGHVSQFNMLLGHRRGRVDNLPIQHNVHVRKSKAFPQSPNVYKMSSYPRGYYILINNIDFTVNDRRDGAENDKEFADILFDMGYHEFRDGYYQNQTKEEMRKLLQDFSKYDALAKVDSCVVAISSHGHIVDFHHVVDGTNDQDLTNLLLCDEIISLFNSKECKLRPGCPKIFIIQACRGKCVLYGGEKRGNPLTVKQTYHQWQDTFFLAPTVEGYAANRDPNGGSWLFMALKDVFKNHAHDQDLKSMAKLLGDKFDEYYQATRFQQSLCYNEYNVNKKLFFNPG